jgi:plasmid stabilization system protein ParE
VTLQVRIAPEAEEELAAAAVWYESKRAGLGAELLAAVDEALERIADAPLAFPVWRERMPFHRGDVRRFPYLIFFTASDAALDVFAFAHAKRRPGYWMDRNRRA